MGYRGIGMEGALNLLSEIGEESPFRQKEWAAHKIIDQMYLAPLSDWGEVFQRLAEVHPQPGRKVLHHLNRELYLSWVLRDSYKEDLPEEIVTFLGTASAEWLRRQKQEKVQVCEKQAHREEGMSVRIGKIIGQAPTEIHGMHEAALEFMKSGTLTDDDWDRLVTIILELEVQPFAWLPDKDEALILLLSRCQRFQMLAQLWSRYYFVTTATEAFQRRFKEMVKPYLPTHTSPNPFNYTADNSLTQEERQCGMQMAASLRWNWERRWFDR